MFVFCKFFNFGFLGGLVFVFGGKFGSFIWVIFDFEDRLLGSDKLGLEESGFC